MFRLKSGIEIFKFKIMILYQIDNFHKLKYIFYIAQSTMDVFKVLFIYGNYDILNVLYIYMFIII